MHTYIHTHSHARSIMVLVNNLCTELKTRTSTNHSNSCVQVKNDSVLTSKYHLFPKFRRSPRDFLFTLQVYCQKELWTYGTFLLCVNHLNQRLFTELSQMKRSYDVQYELACLWSLFSHWFLNYKQMEAWVERVHHLHDFKYFPLHFCLGAGFKCSQYEQCCILYLKSQF